ncbi:MAG: hypothetical protein WBD82_04070 [Acidimicrobiales bacterium]
MNAQELLTKASNNLSVARAFGKAYEKDGLYIIPVAWVAGGGGGGEGPAGPGSTSSEADKAVEDEGDSSNPSGAGFGGVVLPMGAYVVKDEEVRWVPAVHVTLIALAAIGLLRLIARSSFKSHQRHHG